MFVIATVLCATAFLEAAINELFSTAVVPEWDTNLREHAKLEKTLKRRFGESSFASPREVFFPRRCLSHDCAVCGPSRRDGFLQSRNNLETECVNASKIVQPLHRIFRHTVGLAASLLGVSESHSEQFPLHRADLGAPTRATRHDSLG